MTNSNNFGGETHNFHKAPVSQFPRDWPEHARSYRLVIGLYYYSGVLIETDVGAVFSPRLFSSSDHQFPKPLSILDRPIRRRFLDRRGDNIAEPSSRAGVSADRQDHRNALGPGIVRDLED